MASVPTRSWGRAMCCLGSRAPAQSHDPALPRTRCPPRCLRPRRQGACGPCSHRSLGAARLGPSRWEHQQVLLQTQSLNCMLAPVPLPAPPSCLHPEPLAHLRGKCALAQAGWNVRTPPISPMGLLQLPALMGLRLPAKGANLGLFRRPPRQTPLGSSSPFVCTCRLPGPN